MKKVIVLVGLIVFIILQTLLMVSCLKDSFNPFTSTMSLNEEKRICSISGNSAGHTAGKQSKFQLILNNRSGENSWQGQYCILLIDHEGIVEEITHEQFDISVGQETQQWITVEFPENFKGPIGLCVVIPQRSSMVTTLWVGKRVEDVAGPWPNITTCPHFLTGRGSTNLADGFVCNSPPSFLTALKNHSF